MDISRITELFGVYNVESCEKLKNGHINETYLVYCGSERYILRSLNRDVFENPEIVMSNSELIVEAFRDERSVFVPRYLECNGKSYARYGGKIWRMYEYIQCWENYPNKPFNHGFAVGTFLRVVNSGTFKFKNPIPELHDFGGGMELLKVLLPMRNIHGDTKADNIIFGDRPTIIDLDTAMYSFAAVDYGDMIRSITTEKVDLEAIREATKGFANGLEGMLTAAEVNSLYYGIILVIRELFRRYSTDLYFEERNFPNKTFDECAKRANELVNQLGLIRKNEREIVKIINECFG